MEKLGFLFPGQGSQKIGMGQDLYENHTLAREVFEEADEILGFSLSRLCFEGPEEKLRATENAQPAILAVSIAAFRAARAFIPGSWGLSGHSLGEFSALVAAESLAFSDALKLVRRRGQLMAQAVPENRGGMAAIIKLDLEKIQAIISGTGVEIANFNSPEQVVISGYRETLERIRDSFLQEGAKRVVFLNVSAPFHCRLMEPAARGLAQEIEDVPIRKPKFPFWANVTGEKVSDPEEIKALLVQQVTMPVLWEKTINKMFEEGFAKFLVFGPGKTLRILMRSINSGVKLKEISRNSDLEVLIENQENGSLEGFL